MVKEIDILVNESAIDDFFISDLCLLFNDSYKFRILYENKGNFSASEAKEKIKNSVTKLYNSLPHSIAANKLYNDFVHNLSKTPLEFI